jgi:ankyrin repeat protein
MFKRFFCFALVVMTVSAALSAAPNPKALRDAIDKGNLKKVKQLVEAGADVNNDGGIYNAYPLVRAVKFPEILEYLLENGAEHKEEAFDSAMWWHHYATAKRLAEAGIDISDRSSLYYHVLTDKNLTLEQQIETIKDISNNTFNNPNILLSAKPETYQKLIDAFNLKLTDKIDKSGRTLLHTAVDSRDADLTKFLIEKKVNINALDNNNHTALFYAITAYGPSIDWDAPIIENKETARIKFKGDEPYYRNAQEEQQRQISCVMQLLDAKININQQNKDGWTVLHFAASRYPAGLQELLISKNADKTIKTKLGRTYEDILKMRS